MKSSRFLVIFLFFSPLTRGLSALTTQIGDQEASVCRIVSEPNEAYRTLHIDRFQGFSRWTGRYCNGATHVYLSLGSFLHVGIGMEWLLPPSRRVDVVRSDHRALFDIRIDGHECKEAIVAVHHAADMDVLKQMLASSKEKISVLIVAGLLKEFLALPDLDKLRCLTISESQDPIDVSLLARLPRLVALSTNSRLVARKAVNLGHSQLRALAVHGIDAEVLASGALDKLESLELGGENPKTGEYIANRLGSLRSLRIRDCRGVRALDWIGRLRDLRQLELSECDTLEDVSFVDGLSTLQFLSLRDAKRLKRICGLAKCRALLSLTVPDGRPEDMEVLSNLTQLRFLEMRCCRERSRLDVFKQLTQLRTAKLIAMENFDVGLLAGCEHLESLELEEVRFLDLSQLPNLRSLRHLAISPEGKVPFPASDLPRLQTVTVGTLGGGEIVLPKKLSAPHLIRFTATYLGGVQDLASFAECTDLEELEIGNQLHSLEGIQGLSRLRVLKVSSYKNLNSLDPIRNLRTLEVLELSGCLALESIPKLDGLVGLKKLEISDCPNLGSLEALKALRSLEDLTLDYGTSLRGVGHLDQVRRLSIERTGSRDFRDLVGMTGLEKLDAMECDTLSNVDALAKLPGLRTLSIEGDLLQRDVSAIGRLAKLKSLWLCKVPVSDLGFCSSMRSLQNLRVENVDELRTLQGIENANSLEYLELAWCGGLHNVDSIKKSRSLRAVKFFDVAIAGWGNRVDDKLDLAFGRKRLGSGSGVGLYYDFTQRTK